MGHWLLSHTPCLFRRICSTLRAQCPGKHARYFAPCEKTSRLHRGGVAGISAAGRWLDAARELLPSVRV